MRYVMSYHVVDTMEEALLIERMAKINDYEIYRVRIEKGINPLDCIKKQYPKDNDDKCGYCEIKLKDADSFTVILNDVTNKLYYFSAI